MFTVTLLPFVLFCICNPNAKESESSIIVEDNYIYILQMVESKEFQMFDFGKKGNMDKYHQVCTVVSTDPQLSV